MMVSRLVISVALSTAAAAVLGQTPPKRPQPASKAETTVEQPTQSAETKRGTEIKRLAKARQQQAASLLISLASDARSFRDLTLRTRSLASIADLMWDLDRDQARILFAKAWDAAEAAERENRTPIKLRQQVLRLAARHDRALAETFLESLHTEPSDAQMEVSRNSLWALPDALQKRLDLAQNLLAAGDVKRALEFAEPSLGAPTMSTVEFLTLLRERDASTADRLYADMIRHTLSGTPEDANIISLLSSYLFTPHMYVMFAPDGRAQSSWRPTTFPPINADAQLRSSFFQTAAGVLLQPVSAAEKNKNPDTLVIRYRVSQRLLPLFEQYAPSSITTSLRSQLQVLRELISEDVRSAEDEWVRKGINPDDAEYKDREQSMLDRIERAKTSAERDDLYLRLAILALEKNKSTARDYADKIDSSELRKQVLAWVDWALARRAVEQKNSETALAFVRKGELSHIQRVWILTQVASLIIKPDREMAISLINDAIAEAGRIDNSDPDRPRGLFAIANALQGVDAVRAWEIAFDAVKAANAAEAFTGEDGVISQSLKSSTQIFLGRDPAPEFDVNGMFGKLAVTDVDRTVELARAFQAEGPRALATIAIATTLLTQESASREVRSTKN
jgi:tetratricopeptide (TPR) repeat protein